MKKAYVDNYVSVPEDVIASAAAYMADEPDNSFATVLESGRLFREAGMTPLYILDKDNMNVHVVAKETFGKKLH